MACSPCEAHTSRVHPCKVCRCTTHGATPGRNPGSPGLGVVAVEGGGEEAGAVGAVRGREGGQVLERPPGVGQGRRRRQRRSSGAELLLTRLLLLLTGVGAGGRVRQLCRARQALAGG